MTREDILRGYPTVTQEGIDAALDFAARQFQGEEVSVFGACRLDALCREPKETDQNHGEHGGKKTRIF